MELPTAMPIVRSVFPLAAIQTDLAAHWNQQRSMVEAVSGQNLRDMLCGVRHQGKQYDPNKWFGDVILFGCFFDGSDHCKVTSGRVEWLIRLARSR